MMNFCAPCVKLLVISACLLLVKNKVIILYKSNNDMNDFIIAVFIIIFDRKYSCVTV